MVRNQEKYDQAVQLRKRGFTLEEIAKFCDISKSTASKWLKNKAFSSAVSVQNKRRVGQDNAKRLRLIAKSRGTERTKRYTEVSREAKHSYKLFADKQLFIAGLMLYKAHGASDGAHRVRFSTSDIDAHRIFIRFISEYAGVERTTIHIWLQLRSNQQEERCMRRWKRVTGLPFSQFYKNHVIPGKTKRDTLHYGVGNTIIGSTVLQIRLNTWLECISKDLR